MRPNSTPCCCLLSRCFVSTPLFNIRSSLSRLASLVSRLSSRLFPFHSPAPHRARFERLVHGRGKPAHDAAHCRVYHLCQNGQPERDRMAALHGGGAEWSDYWQWIQPGYWAARRRGIRVRRYLGQGGVPSLDLIDCSSLLEYSSTFMLHTITTITFNSLSSLFFHSMGSFVLNLSSCNHYLMPCNRMYGIKKKTPIRFPMRPMYSSAKSNTNKTVGS